MFKIGLCSLNLKKNGGGGGGWGFMCIKYYLVINICFFSGLFYFFL